MHNFPGNGFQEAICQPTLANELQWAGLNLAREISKNSSYKERKEPIAIRKTDFVVEERVRDELISVILLEDVHLDRVLNYLEAYKLEEECCSILAVCFLHISG